MIINGAGANYWDVFVGDVPVAHELKGQACDCKKCEAKKSKQK